LAEGKKAVVHGLAIRAADGQKTLPANLANGGNRACQNIRIQSGRVDGWAADGVGGMAGDGNGMVAPGLVAGSAAGQSRFKPSWPLAGAIQCQLRCPI